MFGFLNSNLDGVKERMLSVQDIRDLDLESMTEHIEDVMELLDRVTWSPNNRFDLDEDTEVSFISLQGHIAKIIKELKIREIFGNKLAGCLIFYMFTIIMNSKLGKDETRILLDYFLEPQSPNCDILALDSFFRKEKLIKIIGIMYEDANRWSFLDDDEEEEDEDDDDYDDDDDDDYDDFYDDGISNFYSSSYFSDKYETLD